jgi:hypothetical protein
MACSLQFGATMKSLLTAIVIALSSSTALAEVHDEPGGYVAFGGTAGVHAYSYAGPTFEGGTRFGGLPVFGRLELAAGLATDWQEPAGWFQQTRVGLELRPCTREGRLCGFAGIDLGLAIAQYTTNPDTMNGEDSYGWLSVARTGVDAAAGSVRIRGALEATQHTPLLVGASGRGLALNLAVMHAF